MDVEKFDAGGQLLTVIGGPDAGAGAVHNPQGMDQR
jgi:hypothetical protein